MGETLVNENVHGNPYRIREPSNAALTEIWLVSAVVTVLVIRLYLYLTGYPQVGGDTIHIAHMLWGGLAMVIAFAFVMLFAHPVWKPIAAFVGGVGFGTFIDELGKFITQDNDYFFEPTASIMYGVFIVMYFLARYFDRKREPTEADHLYLAVQGLQWQAIGKLDEHRQAAALEHLEASGNTSPFANQLREMLANAELIEGVHTSRIMRYRDRAVEFYWSLIQRKWLQRIIIGMFMIRVMQVFAAYVLMVFYDTFDVSDGLSFSEWTAVIVGLVSGALGAYALVEMVRQRRVRAFQAVAASALVSLFFGQFFAFAAQQFIAMGGLLVDLGVLGAVRLALSAENERFQEEGGDRVEGPREGLGQFL